MQKRPATTSQVRSHPYVLPSRSGASNHLVNHHYQQQQQQQPQPHNLLHQQMMASHHSHLQQQHHPSTVRWLTPELLEEQLRGSMRYGAPAAAAATNAPLHSSFPNHGRSSQQSLQKSEKSNRVNIFAAFLLPEIHDKNERKNIEAESM